MGGGGKREKNHEQRAKTQQEARPLK
jgi:hypothetical protein